LGGTGRGRRLDGDEGTKRVKQMKEAWRSKEFDDEGRGGKNKEGRKALGCCVAGTDPIREKGGTKRSGRRLLGSGGVEKVRSCEVQRGETVEIKRAAEKRKWDLAAKLTGKVGGKK